MAQAASTGSIGTKRRSWEGQEVKDGTIQVERQGKGVLRGLTLGTVQSLDGNQVGKGGRELGVGVLLGDKDIWRGSKHADHVTTELWVSNLFSRPGKEGMSGPSWSA